MSDPSLRCLVLNAGGTYHPDQDQAVAWADREAGSESSPDIAFIQELPGDNGLAAWLRHGYRAILGYGRGWKVRSAILTLLTERDCPGLTVQDFAELGYHGEYVAAARLPGWGTDGGDLTLVSVHAQPARTTAAYLASYPDARTLTPRDGGGDPRYRGELFDADVVLETIRRRAPDVLACGDLNEARGWDDVPGHAGQTWGAEYFGRPDAEDGYTDGVLQRAGLVDVPLAPSGAEVVTRRAPGHPALHLDHIVTTSRLATRIREVAVDTAWSEQRPEAIGLADHAPIRFMFHPPNPT